MFCYADSRQRSQSVLILEWDVYPVLRCLASILSLILTRRCILLILERKEGGERNIDMSNMDQLSPVCIPARDRTHNLGMCPDQGSNPQPFGVQNDAPTIRASWPGP